VSLNTLQSYKRDLKQFENYLGTIEGKYNELTNDGIKDYIKLNNFQIVLNLFYMIEVCLMTLSFHSLKIQKISLIVLPFLPPPMLIKF